MNEQQPINEKGESEGDVKDEDQNEVESAWMRTMTDVVEVT